MGKTTEVSSPSLWCRWPDLPEEPSVLSSVGDFDSTYCLPTASVILSGHLLGSWVLTLHKKGNRFREELGKGNRQAIVVVLILN